MYYPFSRSPSYRDWLKSMWILPGRIQAGHVSKIRNKLLATTYHLFSQFLYIDWLKSMQILLSRTQAEQLRKRRKKFLATTYKLFADLCIHHCLAYGFLGPFRTLPQTWLKDAAVNKSSVLVRGPCTKRKLCLMSTGGLHNLNVHRPKIWLVRGLVKFVPAV